MKKKLFHEIKSFLLIAVATAIYAVGISLFLDPNQLAPGGVTGIAVILNRLVNIETGKISNPATQYGELQNGNLGNMFSACEALAGELVGRKNQSTYRPYTPSYSSSSSMMKT